MSDRPTISYWHLWTDADGISRLTQCTMTEFELKSMNAPADPQWQGMSFTGKMTTMVTVQPVGWIGTWHENPKPQWIVPLSGHWFVEATMDGKRIEMGPGEISFGGDQNCREIDGKRGHRSGTLGEVPAVLMVVQLEEASTHLLPCEFR
jgi:hypothetical protein